MFFRNLYIPFLLSVLASAIQYMQLADGTTVPYIVQSAAPTQQTQTVISQPPGGFTTSQVCHVIAGSFEPRHTKPDFKVYVIVIPKEGLTSTRPASLLLV